MVGSNPDEIAQGGVAVSWSLCPESESQHRCPFRIRSRSGIVQMEMVV